MKSFSIVLAAGLCALAVALLTSPVGLAGDDTDHDKFHIHGLDEFEKIDLAELADGETRRFPSGDGEVIVTRDGDTIRLTRDPSDGDKDIEIKCPVGAGSCQLLLGDLDGTKTSMLLSTRALCDDGDENCNEDIRIAMFTKGLASSFGHTEDVYVVTDGDEDGKRIQIKTAGIAEAARNFAFTIAGDAEGLVHGDGKVLVIETNPDGRIKLVCPEGDVTMKVDKDDADSGYRCPKHGVLLERAKTHEHLRRLQIKREKKSD